MLKSVVYTRLVKQNESFCRFLLVFIVEIYSTFLTVNPLFKGLLGSSYAVKRLF